MKKILFTAILILLATLLVAFSEADLDFLNHWTSPATMSSYKNEVKTLLKDPNLPASTLKKIVFYSERTDQKDIQARALLRLSYRYQDIEAALDLIRLNQRYENLSAKILIGSFHHIFANPADSLSFLHLRGEIDDSLFVERVKELDSYNGYLEDIAKNQVIAFATRAADSLALPLIDDFENSFPKSGYRHYGLYYRLYHLFKAQDYAALKSLIMEEGDRSYANAFVASQFLLNQDFLMHYEEESPAIFDKTEELLSLAIAMWPEGQDIYEVLWQTYDASKWESKIRLEQLKLGNRRLMKQAAELPDSCFFYPPIELARLLNLAETIEFENNDFGQQAELAYWKAKSCATVLEPFYQETAAKYYLDCLIKGSPRKFYDEEALGALTEIHQRLEVEEPLEQWYRKLVDYKGIVFEDATQRMGLEDKRYTRIAIGDYDNDGWLDLLFNGCRIYRSMEGEFFSDLSDSLNTSFLQSSGGLWADFNLDGYLDFVSISHQAGETGDALMKNHENTRFLKVNERAGDIDDGFPSEAAAWIDIDNSGYPSLYIANYETWQQRAGFPDFFWHNEKGYFKDKSGEMGFRSALDMDNPGLAGRGIAPADYNDDGITDILVTNYRLHRNFLFTGKNPGFEDRAFESNVAGHYTQGYYGHSIGADWGDYDNDGDLDLFIANLAHPRYIDFSDISMLLRNDGPATYQIGDEVFHYHLFTDVTKEAGISYDELHSDPLWADFDNDGLLDLFITSVYENDRSYLYHNNGDGTFTDISWLSGARVYNGWGNAFGDLDRDGLIDLVTGSGNGTKILINATPTPNESVFVKPVWDKGEIQLPDHPRQFSQFPNSPAFGTRVKINLSHPDGSSSTLVRELNSAKGTCSQNAPELHFGIGDALDYELEQVIYDKN